jgi:hypothetical protein
MQQTQKSYQSHTSNPKILSEWNIKSKDHIRVIHQTQRSYQSQTSNPKIISESNISNPKIRSQSHIKVKDQVTARVENGFTIWCHTMSQEAHKPGSYSSVTYQCNRAKLYLDSSLIRSWPGNRSPWILCDIPSAVHVDSTFILAGVSCQITLNHLSSHLPGVQVKSLGSTWTRPRVHMELGGGGV